MPGPTCFVPDFPLKRRPPEPRKKPACLGYIGGLYYSTGGYWGLWSQVTPVGTIVVPYRNPY